MICKVCGSQINEGSRFCSNCGSKVEWSEPVRIEKQSVTFTDEKDFNIPEFTREESKTIREVGEETSRVFSKANFSWDTNGFEETRKESIRKSRINFDWNAKPTNSFTDSSNTDEAIRKNLDETNASVHETVKEKPKRFSKPEYDPGNLFVVPERKIIRKKEIPKRFFTKDQSVYEVEIQEMPQGRGLSADDFLKALKEEPQLETVEEVSSPESVANDILEIEPKPQAQAVSESKEEIAGEVKQKANEELYVGSKIVETNSRDKQEQQLENEYQKIHQEINPGDLSVTQEMKFEEMIAGDEQVDGGTTTKGKETLASKEKIIDEIIERAEKPKEDKTESDFNGFVPQFEKDKTIKDEKKDMFGFEDSWEETPEVTKRIDKFYTFNAKNQEFQQLLDDEYDRIKGEEEVKEIKAKIIEENKNDVKELAYDTQMHTQTPRNEESDIDSVEIIKATDKESDETAKGSGLSKTTWINILQDDYDEKDLTKEEKKKLKEEEKAEKRREKEARKQQKLAVKANKKIEKLGKKQEEILQEETPALTEEKLDESPQLNKTDRNTQEISAVEPKEIHNNTRMSEPLEVRKDLSKLAQGEEIAVREVLEEEDEVDTAKVSKGVKITIIILSIIAALLIALLAIKLISPGSSISKYMDKVLGMQNEEVRDFDIISAVEAASSHNKNLGKISCDQSLVYNKDANYGAAKLKSSYPFHDSVFFVNDDGSEVMYGQNIINTIIDFYSEIVNCKGELTNGLRDCLAAKSDIRANPGIVLGETGGVTDTALRIGDIRTSEKGFFVITSLSYKNLNSEAKEKMQVVYLTAGEKKIFVNQVTQA